MTTSQTSAWLKAGIAALKAGERDKAKTLLLQVIEVDEKNEQAWLWLSGAVSGKEDRQICLENVLAINPDNEIAKKGLTRLGVNPEQTPDRSTAVSPPEDSSKSQTVRREYEPLSAAAAILYPERQVKEWAWEDPTPDHQPSQVGFASQSKYNDVWSREADICAYCAAEIGPAVEKCPQCKRKLTVNQFRYPKPSPSLHLLWVALFGISLISLVQLFFNVIFEGNVALAVINGILVGTFAVLGFGIYFRQAWAFLLTLVMLSLILILALAQYLLPPTFSSTLLSEFDPSISRVLGGLAGGIGGFFRIFRLTAVIFALVMAIFRVASDFSRVQTRQLAVLGGRMRHGSDYHDTALRAARNGQWATAVLHWQRAAAVEPTQHAYQKHLGQAYAHLGFFQRSLDVLQSARTRATHPEKQAELDQMMRHVQQKLAEQANNNIEAT